tara:strand:+ start:303 stop:869 length:567 start_codon:yes stop_codon:yes gene_type:complete
MTETTNLPFTEYFHEWRKLGEVQAAYPDYKKAEEVWDAVRDKLNDIKGQVQCKTQYSTTHDAALGILNNIKLDFECGTTIGKKASQFAEKYFGMWSIEETLFENLEESLEVLRAAKRSDFRKIIELEDQLPKLRADEERTRKLWIMESDKIKPVWEKLKEEHDAAKEKERQQKIQDDSENNNTEEEAE